MKAFAYMNLIEAWGSGIPRIIQECKEYGLQKPEFIDADGFLRINLYRKEPISAFSQTSPLLSPESTGESTGESKVAILEVIQDTLAITIPEIAERTGLFISGVEKNIRQLKQAGILCHIGATKRGHWKIIEKSDEQAE